MGFITSSGSIGGIFVVWDVRRIKVVESLLGDFLVTIKVEGDFGGYMKYTVPIVTTKEVSFDELAGLWSLCGQRWCVVGDFNVTRFLSEKCDSDRITRSMRIFDEFIRDLNLSYPHT